MDDEKTEETPEWIIPSTLSRQGGNLDSSMPTPASPKPHNGYGVSVAMLIWAACFFVFPKVVAMSPLVTDLLYVTGFVTLLMGVLGLCIEIFKGKK